MWGCRVDFTGRYFCGTHGMCAQRFAKRRLPEVHKPLAFLLWANPSYKWLLFCLKDELAVQLLKWPGDQTNAGHLFMPPMLPRLNQHKRAIDRRCAPGRRIFGEFTHTRCQAPACSADLAASTRKFWGQREVCRKCYERNLRATTRADDQFRVLKTLAQKHEWLLDALKPDLAKSLRASVHCASRNTLKRKRSTTHITHEERRPNLRQETVMGISETLKRYGGGAQVEGLSFHDYGAS